MSSSLTETIRLGEVAYARSGDKGNDANIGVWTHDDATWDHLRAVLTEGVVAAHFAALCRGGVTRYELANLRAFNFVLHEALDGGGPVSLRTDAQGKTLSLGMLELRLPPLPAAPRPTPRPTPTDPDPME